MKNMYLGASVVCRHVIVFSIFQAGEAGEESSDSDGEQEETSHKLIRKVSTSGQIRAKVGTNQRTACGTGVLRPRDSQ